MLKPRLWNWRLKAHVANDQNVQCHNLKLQPQTAEKAERRQTSRLHEGVRVFPLYRMGLPCPVTSFGVTLMGASGYLAADAEQEIN